MGIPKPDKPVEPRRDKVVESDIDIAQSITSDDNTKRAVNYRNTEVNKALALYSTGYPVTVEYFSKIDSSISKQTLDTQLPESLEDLSNVSYHYISNMEVKLESNISMDADTDLTEWSLTGSMLMYPDSNPRVGDIFLYNLSSTITGLFQITSITPSSISSGSMFLAEFYFREEITGSVYNLLKKAVVDTFVFERSRVYTDDSVLLTSEEYNDIGRCEEMLSSLEHHLLSNYYSHDYQTYLIPMGENELDWYDPFLIEFLSSIITHEYGGVIDGQPRQYCQTYVDQKYLETIWYKLINPDKQILPKCKKYVKSLYIYQYYDAVITGMINRPIVGVVENVDQVKKSPYAYSTKVVINEHERNRDNLDNYVVSDGLYESLVTGSIDNLVDFDKVLFKAITNNLNDIETDVLVDIVFRHDLSSVTIGLDDIYKTTLLMYILKRYLNTLKRTF